MSEVKKIWDEGASFYDRIYENNVSYHRSHEAIVDLLPKNKPMDVLDLGAGTGLLAERILQAIPKSRVTCLEFSEKMCEQARQRLRSFGERGRCVCADMTVWEPEQDYDAVVSCNALVYKDINLGEVYKKYARHLKPGGLLLNSTVAESSQLSLIVEIAQNAKSPDTPPYPQKVLEFAQTKGEPITHFGPDSLAFALTTDEHLRLITETGMTALCFWQYLVQAIVGGVKK